VTCSHLTLEAVKAIHAEVLAAHGGAAGVRDHALLESAVAAPQATAMGNRSLQIRLRLPRRISSISPRNHLFMDGNKRTALATCLVFLSENGLLPDEGLDADAWEFLTMDVAANRIDREQTTERLRALTPKSGKK
jgi:death on curing protein